MVDNLTPEQRKKNMRSIRSKNTKPEIALRKFLFSEGYRFRVHNILLPGKPDLMLRKYKAVVFVNGCFWHQHEGCKYAVTPKSNIEFWEKKFEETLKRDKKNIELLLQKQWRVLVFWECALRGNKGSISGYLEEVSKWLRSSSTFIEVPSIDSEIIRSI